MVLLKKDQLIFSKNREKVLAVFSDNFNRHIANARTPDLTSSCPREIKVSALYEGTSIIDGDDNRPTFVGHSELRAKGQLLMSCSV